MKFLKIQQYSSIHTPTIKKEVLINLNNVIHFEKFTGQPFAGKTIAYLKNGETIYLSLSFDELTKGRIDIIEFHEE